MEQCNALGERKDVVYLFEEHIERESKKGLPTIPDGYLERTGDDDEERDEEMAVADEEVAVDENDHMEVVDEEVDYQQQLLEQIPIQPVAVAEEDVYHMEVVAEEDAHNMEVAVAAWWGGSGLSTTSSPGTNPHPASGSG